MPFTNYSFSRDFHTKKMSKYFINIGPFSYRYHATFRLISDAFAGGPLSVYRLNEKRLDRKRQNILVRQNSVFMYYVLYIYKPKGCYYVVIYSAGHKSLLLLRICRPRGSDGRSEFIVVKQVRGRFIVRASNFTAIKLRLGSRTLILLSCQQICIFIV
jgi:hypothetical protein